MSVGWAYNMDFFLQIPTWTLLCSCEECVRQTHRHAEEKPGFVFTYTFYFASKDWKTGPTVCGCVFLRAKTIWQVKDSFKGREPSPETMIRTQKKPKNLQTGVKSWHRESHWQKNANWKKLKNVFFFKWSSNLAVVLGYTSFVKVTVLISNHSTVWHTKTSPV